MSANEMIFPQAGRVCLTQGQHGDPPSEDCGHNASKGGPPDQDYLASYDGVIEFARDGYGPTSYPDRGNYYTLLMDNGCKIRVLHCQKGSMLVKTGQRVTKYQKIAKMGNSGYCINGAPHAHITFWDATGKVVLPSKSALKVIRTATIPEDQTSFLKYESEEPVAKFIDLPTNSSITVKKFSGSCQYFETTSVDKAKGTLPVGGKYMALQKSDAKINGFDWVTFKFTDGKVYYTVLLDDRLTLTLGGTDVELEKRVAELEAKNTALEAKIAAIEATLTALNLSLTNAENGISTIDKWAKSYGG